VVAETSVVGAAPYASSVTVVRNAKSLFTESSGHVDGDAVIRALGGALLVATGADHLDLYLTGYRSIPTIGPLFVVQFVAAFALGLALLVLVFARQTANRKAVGILSWQEVVGGSGALLSLGTLLAYLASLGFGIFGYKEIRTTAGIFAAILEIVAFVLLSRVACEGLPPGNPAGLIRAVSTSVAVTLLAVAEAAAVLPAATPGQLTAAPPGQLHVSNAIGAPPVVTVVIKNFGFQPPDPTVHPGEEILVENEDAVAHTLSSLPGSAIDVSFSTGAIAPGHSAELVAPRRPGHYAFICLIHQFMKGTLVVTST
jgi:plastocyanin